MANEDKEEKKELTQEEYERLDNLYKNMKFGSLSSLGLTSLTALLRSRQKDRNKNSISRDLMQNNGVDPLNTEGLDNDTKKKLDLIVYGGIPLSALTAGYSYYKHYKLKKDYKEQQEEKKRREEEAKEEKKNSRKRGRNNDCFKK